MFERYLKPVYSFVWESDIRAMPKQQSAFIQALRIIHCTLRDLFDGMLTLQAMSLVYTTLLSLVPLIAVSFSVLKGFGVHNEVEPLLYNLLAPLGDKGVEVTQKIIEFVENTRAGVLGSLGLALLFYTVVSLIQKIERSFNYTWRVTQHRPFAQRFSDYLSVILLGPLLIFTALGITASVMSSETVQQLMSYETIGWFVRLLTRLVPYMLVIAAFTLVYIFVPNTRVKVKAAFIGAIVAGVLWETIGWAFASFIVTSTKYTAIYSAFATLIFFMIWLYLCWMILLIGASIAFYVQHPEYRTLQNRIFKLSNRMKEKIALLTMAIISGNYYSDEDPIDEYAIAKKLEITPEMLEPILGALIEHKLLVRTNGVTSGLVPAHPPELTKAVDILNVIRQAEEHTDSSFDTLPRHEFLESCYSNLDSAMISGFGDVSLKDLALHELQGRKEQKDSTVQARSQAKVLK